MPPYEFEVVSLEAQPTVTIRFLAKPSELGAKFGEVLPATYQHAMSQGCQISGQPFARYHAFDESGGIFDVEAGVPVSEAVAGRDNITPSELPAGAAVSMLHVGPYEQLGEAHQALGRWVAENGKHARGGAWEVYLTDPGNEPDPQKLQTQLIQPIE